MRAAAIFLAVSIVAMPVLANAQAPSPRRTPRIEGSFAVGVSRPSIVVLQGGGLRTRPSIDETGDRHLSITREGIARILWGGRTRTSTIVSLGWSSHEHRSYEFPRPLTPPPFPFSNYRAELTSTHRYRVIGLSQAWDFTSASIVPFGGGGVELRMVDRTEDRVSIGYSDPSLRLAGKDERSASQTSIHVLGGVRFPIGTHGVVSAEAFGFVKDFEGRGGIRRYQNQDTARTLLGTMATRWRVTAGIRF